MKRSQTKVTISVDDGINTIVRTFPIAENVVFEAVYDDANLVDGTQMLIDLKFKAFLDPVRGYIYAVGTPGKHVKTKEVRNA